MRSIAARALAGLRRPAGGELRRGGGRCGSRGVRSVARVAGSHDHDGAARRRRRRHAALLLRARRDPARHRLSRAASSARELERPVPEVRRRHEGRRSRLRRSSLGARLRRREQQHGPRRRLRARRVVRVRQPPSRDRFRLSRRASHRERRQERRRGVLRAAGRALVFRRLLDGRARRAHRSAALPERFRRHRRRRARVHVSGAERRPHLAAAARVPQRLRGQSRIRCRRRRQARELAEARASRRRCARALRRQRRHRGRRHRRAARCATSSRSATWRP